MVSWDGYINDEALLRFLLNEDDIWPSVFYNSVGLANDAKQLYLEVPTFCVSSSLSEVSDLMERK